MMKRMILMGATMGLVLVGCSSTPTVSADEVCTQLSQAATEGNFTQVGEWAEKQNTDDSNLNDVLDAWLVQDATGDDVYNACAPHI